MSRVAIVIQHYPPYLAGAERQAQLLGRLLSERGRGCDVITTKFRPDLPFRENQGEVMIRRLPTGFTGDVQRGLNFLVSFLYFIMYGHRYDVVHGHCLSAFVLGAVAGAKLRGCKVLLKVCAVGENGEVNRLKQYPFGNLFWNLTNRADIVIAQTPSGSAELVAAGLPREKIRVIPGAVDPEIVRRSSANARVEVRRMLGLPDGNLVLFVGRLEKGKGLDLLLSAWTKVIRSYDATLVLVGGGPEMASLVAMSSGEKWRNSLRLFGWRSDPENFFRAADIFVFPSKSEAFGNVLAEAMAHGLPIVSTRVGLACDWMRDGNNAVLISGEAPEELAEAVIRLIDDATLRKRLGDEAKEVARRYFSSELLLETHLDLYERLSKGSLGSNVLGKETRNL